MRHRLKVGVRPRQVRFDFLDFGVLGFGGLDDNLFNLMKRYFVASIQRMSIPQAKSGPPPNSPLKNSVNLLRSRVLRRSTAAAGGGRYFFNGLLDETPAKVGGMGSRWVTVTVVHLP